MPAAPKHRQAIVDAAVRLFRRQGYAGTGLAQILSESGAPKGSLYHYFPDGKAQIGAEAVATAGQTVARTLTELAATAGGPAELIGSYLGLVEGWMRDSDFRDGSPLTTTLLEMAPDDEAIQGAGATAFAEWASIIERSALDAGLAPADARPLAEFALAAVEGALIQCRVSADGAPLRNAARHVEVLASSLAARGGTTI